MFRALTPVEICASYLVLNHPEGTRIGRGQEVEAVRIYSIVAGVGGVLLAGLSLGEFFRAALPEVPCPGGGVHFFNSVLLGKSVLGIAVGIGLLLIITSWLPGPHRLAAALGTLLYLRSIGNPVVRC